jgi:WD40 repeat protein
MSVYDHIPPGFTPLHGEPPRQNRTINRIAWSPDGQMIASPSDSQAIRLWDTQSGQSLRTLSGHTGVVYSVAWSPDEQKQELASSSSDGTVRIWDAQSGQSLRTLTGHQGAVHSVAWSPDGSVIASGSLDKTIRLWDARTGDPLQTLIGHSEPVYSVAWSLDGELIASGSSDGLIYLWDPKSGRQIRCLEGHTGVITCISFSSDSRLLASKSRDRTVRIWRTDTWMAVTAMKESASIHSLNAFSSLAFHPRSPILASLGANRLGMQDTIINVWLLDVDTVLRATPDASSIYYTNAKVALVGDSGVGKSALALVLTGRPFAPTESTHGRKVWDFRTQRVKLGKGHEEIHETLLWDLAGQPGYRLIHQLHLNEVAVALIVFDARSETDPFAGVYHWVRSLQVAQRVQSVSGSPTKKFLIAARIDRGGKSVTPARINTLIQELKLDGYFEVSARDGLDIDKVIDAIEHAIVWEALPKVTSTDLFQRIKEFLSVKKQTGRLLSTVEDLYGEFLNFEGRLTETGDLFAQFETCIGLVEAKDLIRRFSFGDLVLLQPERLDAYASALITVARDEPDGLGSILEKEARAGNFYIPDRQ